MYDCNACLCVYVFMYLHGHHYFHEIRLERGVKGGRQSQGKGDGGGTREGAREKFARVTL
jgi:hypothetical protein